MNNIIIKRSQIVECQFTGTPATNKRYPFLTIPNLSRNNIILYGIEALTADQLAVTPNSNTVIAAANAVNVVVTLRDNNKDEFLYQYPIYNLIRTNVGGFFTLIKPRIINLTDCVCQLVAAGTIATNQVAAFNLIYSIVGED
jgi:hypothetical protein